VWCSGGSLKPIDQQSPSQQSSCWRQQAKIIPPTLTEEPSLLGTISSKEVLKKNNRGIFTIFQLSHTFRPKKGKKTKKQTKCEWALKALALREKVTYISIFQVRFPHSY